MKKNDVQEIFACFKPLLEGNLQEKVILACDNQTNALFTLQGVGNMVEFKITGLDNLVFDSKNDLLKKIYFPDAIPNKSTTRHLKIKNLTGVSVQYHWTYILFSFFNKSFFLWQF